VSLVIDPLIDGVTGAQSIATQLMEKRIGELVRASYPRFEVAKFSSDSVATGPVVLIGTFTAINNAGQGDGPRDAYRICLALADLHTNRIISKGVARAVPEGINVTPTAFFAESPVYARDGATDGYVRSCQGTKLGDPIDPVYIQHIQVASVVSDGVEAYNGRRYRDALDLYQSALRMPGGEQLSVLNGLYLSYAALRRTSEANEAFGKVVDYGLNGDKLAVKFLFQTGSTQFVRDQRVSAPYDNWLQTIAERTVAKKVCLEVVGHTSATGHAALNDRLSVARAEAVKDRLEADSTDLRGRLIAAGRGSREMIVGTGKDDASDAVDRRVEMKVVHCFDDNPAPQAPADTESPRIAARNLAPLPPVAPAPPPAPPPLSAEEICKRDTATLARLRASLARDEVLKFDQDLGCERLRAQVTRLRESVETQ
jgi:outer membrane protein OmpA-like peptidoglycan-associated protein